LAHCSDPNAPAFYGAGVGFAQEPLQFMEFVRLKGPRYLIRISGCPLPFIPYLERGDPFIAKAFKGLFDFILPFVEFLSCHFPDSVGLRGYSRRPL